MRITVSGLTKRITEMQEMAARVRDMTPAFQAAAEAITKGISDRFRSATGWDGAPWKPLAASTVRQRRKKSNKILQDTGILKNSNTATASKRSVAFGTNVPYAGIHQFGGTVHQTRVGHWRTVDARGRFRKNSAKPRKSDRLRAISGHDRAINITARPFLPVVKLGGRFAFSTGAPADALLARIRRYLSSYIRTGKVT